MEVWNSLVKHRLFRHFLPFMILVVGGSFGLREFAEIRYRFGKPQMTEYKELLEKEGIKPPAEKVTLESEYQKIKTMDLEKWENVRIPRPWDEEADAKK